MRAKEYLVGRDLRGKITEENADVYTPATIVELARERDLSFRKKGKPSLQSESEELMAAMDRTDQALANLKKSAQGKGKPSDITLDDLKSPLESESEEMALEQKRQSKSKKKTPSDVIREEATNPSQSKAKGLWEGGYVTQDEFDAMTPEQQDSLKRGVQEINKNKERRRQERNARQQREHDARVAEWEKAKEASDSQLNGDELSKKRKTKVSTEPVQPSEIASLDRQRRKKNEAESTSMFNAKLRRGDIEGAIDQALFEADRGKDELRQAQTRMDAKVQETLDKYPLLGDEKKGHSSLSDSQSQSGEDRKKLQRAVSAYQKRLARRDEKIQRMRERKAYPSAPAPGSVMDFDVSELNFDPNRFQYKLIHGATGSSGSLTGVRKWDPNLAGIVQVWTDPEDGKTYVVNGHNRANLAKNKGVDKVTVRFLDVADAKEARAVGALTNIAEGRGNALDAAKFFRDSGISKQELEEKGIPMKEKIANEGLAIAGLSNDLFQRVVLGDISQSRAVQIGGAGLDHNQQRSLLDLIEKTEKKKAVTQSTLDELIGIVKSSETMESQQLGLFGMDTTAQNLAVEKARLQSSIRSKLSREKNLFGRVGGKRAAEELAKAGNVIESSHNKKISQDAEIAMIIFDTFKNQKSEVSDLLNEATRRISNGESSKKVESELYSRLRDILPTLGLGTKKPNPKRSEEDDDFKQPTLFEERRLTIFTTPLKPFRNYATTLS